jgi:cysteine desulfurase family protein
VLGGMKYMVYFDNAATTFPKPEEVYTFMDTFYRNYGVNVGRGQHKLASTASKIVEETRNLILELFHCNNKKVVFTHTATEAINLVLRGIPISNNYNIYISPFEHNAVTRVLHYLQKQYKINIYTLAVNETTLKYDIERIKYQFYDNKPNLVIMSHASNVCGVVAPIVDICKLSKELKAINVIDMCQTAGLIDTDLSSELMDFVVFAGHKTLYGPIGIAGIICSNNIKLTPLLYGGTGIDSASQELPETIPEKYEVASQNIMAISGLNASLRWIKSVGINEIYNKELLNHSKLNKILSKYKNIRLIKGLEESSTVGVVSCVFENYSSDGIGQILSENDIAVRTGLHCSPLAHKFLGTFPAGTVRFSVSYFNNDEDFEKLKEVLEFIESSS